MHLSDADLRDLAAFLARRMTTDFAPVDPTDAPLAGVTNGDAWMAVLVEARDGGWLPSLVNRITAARPYDATLREAASLLVPKRNSVELRIAALLLATGTLGLGGVAGAGVLAGALLVALEALQEPQEHTHTSAAETAYLADHDASADPTIVSDDGTIVSVAPAAERLSLVGDGLHVAVDLDAAPADPDGDPEAVSADLRGEDGPPEGISEPGVVASVPRGGPHFSSEKCGGPPGEAVGDWYAGRHSPGPAGTEVVLDRMINVRTEYPHRGNRWNTRSRIHCVLRPGDVATIRVDPLEIEGGHVWVPVHAGDIRAPTTDGTADASAPDDLQTAGNQRFDL